MQESRSRIIVSPTIVMRLNLSEPDIEQLRARWLQLSWRGLDGIDHVEGSLQLLPSDISELILWTEKVPELFHLTRFDRLDYLYLMGCTDEEFAKLPKLPQLRHLILKGPHITAAPYLERFPNLEVLSFWGASRMRTLPDLKALRDLK